MSQSSEPVVHASDAYQHQPWCSGACGGVCNPDALSPRISPELTALKTHIFDDQVLTRAPPSQVSTLEVTISADRTCIGHDSTLWTLIRAYIPQLPNIVPDGGIVELYRTPGLNVCGLNFCFPLALAITIVGEFVGEPLKAASIQTPYSTFKYLHTEIHRLHGRGRDGKGDYRKYQKGGVTKAAVAGVYCRRGSRTR